jgi:hypothetical protein
LCDIIILDTERGIKVEKKEKTIGLCMPISKMGNKDSEHWKQVKEFIFKTCKCITNYSIEVALVSDDENKEIIHKNIVSNLYQNDVVICDVSENNPNVFFELGMRLAFNKPTIIIKDESTKYSFDSGIIKHISYPDDLNYFSMETFGKELQNRIISTFTSLNNQDYEPFLDSLNLQTVKTASIKYQDIDFNEFVIEKLKSIEYSVSIDQKKSQNTDSILRIKQAYKIRKPIRLALLSLEEKIDKEKFISVIDIEDEYKKNLDLKAIINFDVFQQIAEQYFEDRGIDILPF